MAGLTFRKRKKRINYNIIKEAFVWAAELVLAFFIACLLVVNFGVMTSNVPLRPARQVETERLDGSGLHHAEEY